jgi:hypothetical protein
MGGVGADSPYAAGSFIVDTQSVLANVAYIVARPEFRRIFVDSPSSAESDRENVSVALRPGSTWSISASHRNLLEPEERTTPRVTVNQVTGTANAGGLRLNAGLFESRREKRDNVGTSFGVGYSITPAVDTTVSYYRSSSTDGSHSDSVVGTFRETLGPRFALVQLVTRAAGQTSFNAGGSFLSNLLTVGLDYQTVYAPFREPNPFVQALSLNVRLAIRDVQIQLATYTMPDGRTRYTISGSQALYRSGAARGSSQSGGRFAKYLIRGTVVDDSGRPVAGAALRIGRELVLTDDEGAFFLRVRKRQTYPLEVAMDEFVRPGVFEVADAPAIVSSDTDDAAPEVHISLRRVASHAG